MRLVPNFSALSVAALGLALVAPRSFADDAAAAAPAAARIDWSEAGARQEIDGFGACPFGIRPDNAGWVHAFLDELHASILRLDLVPRFKEPWSSFHYYSPWFLGRTNAAAPPAFNLESGPDQGPRHYSGPPDLEFVEQRGQTYFNGPEGNRARTYTNAVDYQREFAGKRAPIAVMGPNIDDNIDRYFDWQAEPIRMAESFVAAARARNPELRDFKVIGSIWSPAPWLKVSSGNVVSEQYGRWPFATPGTPMPLVGCAGNFVGGRLDTSGEPREAFDDSKLPADSEGPHQGAPQGPTSALTQFARCTAATLRGLQRRLGVSLDAVSIQNELNFETFYNSCTYPDAAGYVAALKAVRAELDRYDDLKGIRLKGPEDLLADSTHSLWQYGGGDRAVHKNLQYLQAVAADPAARRALALACIHGYAADGTSSAGADPVAWDRWANGWSEAPASGLPDTVAGFRSLGIKSWMTETSGERGDWLWPPNAFPSGGAWSIALKIHQALVVGQQSAWVYWGLPGPSGSPKLTAARHFFQEIRPGMRRHEARVQGSAPEALKLSAFRLGARHTVVIVNADAGLRTLSLPVPPDAPEGDARGWISSAKSLWREVRLSPQDGAIEVLLPGYGVATVVW